MTPIAVPIAAIDEAALPRDRSALDAEPLDELQASIAANGLRQPIEVWELAEPDEARRYGLISGFRRLAAVRRLHATARDKDRWATVPAFVRTPDSYAAAMAAMVEENEIRAGISPFERGLICVVAAREGIYETIDAAVEALYASASRQKRHRVRMLAHVADELFDDLTEPHRLTAHQCFRIARALTAGFGPVIRCAVQQSGNKDPEHQWSLIEPVLREADENAVSPERSHRPGRPRRILRPRYGLVVRRVRTQDGWSLQFTGPEASGPLMDHVLDEIERMFAAA